MLNAPMLKSGSQPMAVDLLMESPRRLVHFKDGWGRNEYGVSVRYG